MHLFPHQEVRAEIHYLFLDYLENFTMWLFDRISFYFSSHLILDGLPVLNTSVVFSGVLKLKRTLITMPDYSVLIFWYSSLSIFAH